MKKILCYGSLNIDHVYRMREFVRAGETVSALEYQRFAGGKGLNQTVALARANESQDITFFHGGKIGEDGLFLRDLLMQEGVDCKYLTVTNSDSTGHAIIQVTNAGENSIILYGGANQLQSEPEIESCLSNFSEGDFLVLQNEINGLDSLIRLASAKKMRIFFNPAPMTPDVAALPLELVDTLIVNEIEYAELPKDALGKSNILLTQGAKGADYLPKDSNEPTLHIDAGKVEKVIDTTAAGDTFTGYFVMGMATELTPYEAMELATKASAHCISIAGAMPAIPRLSELK